MGPCQSSKDFEFDGFHESDIRSQSRRQHAWWYVPTGGILVMQLQRPCGGCEETALAVVRVAT